MKKFERELKVQVVAHAIECGTKLTYEQIGEAFEVSGSSVGQWSRDVSIRRDAIDFLHTQQHPPAFDPEPSLDLGEYVDRHRDAAENRELIDDRAPQLGVAEQAAARPSAPSAPSTGSGVPGIADLPHREIDLGEYLKRGNPWTQAKISPQPITRDECFEILSDLALACDQSLDAVSIAAPFHGVKIAREVNRARALARRFRVFGWAHFEVKSEVTE